MPRSSRIVQALLMAAIFCGAGLLSTIQLIPNLFIMGFAVTVAAVTTTLLIGFDRRTTRYEAFPFLDLAMKAIGIATLLSVTWILFFGIVGKEKFAIVAALFGGFYAALIGIPVCFAYTVIRKRIRPLDSDNFLRCRRCEYRVDNITGPRCPECGTVIDGSYDAQP